MNLPPNKLHKCYGILLMVKAGAKQEAAIEDREHFNEYHTALLQKWKQFFYKAKKPTAGGCSYPIKNLLPAVIMIMYMPARMRYRKDG